VNGSARARVTVGLVQGGTRTGTVGPFTPRAPDLTIDVDAPAAPGTHNRELVATERVAYVAFHRTANEKVPLYSGATRYRIHMAGQTTLEVNLRESPAEGALGFTGYPTRPDGPYKEVFFYMHGVVRREKDEPLGTMLVRSGAVQPEALARAIEVQHKNRAVPIGEILIEQRKVTRTEVEQAAQMQQRRHLRIGQVLKEAGLATEQDIELALTEQKKRRGKRLGEVLIEMKILTEADLAKTLARKFDLPFVDLDACITNPQALNEIPREVIAKHGILPVDVDTRSLTVAIADPLALDGIDALRLHTNRKINEVLVLPSQLKAHVERAMEKKEEPQKKAGNVTGLDEILKQISKTKDATPEDEDEAPVVEATNDGGVVSLANQILIEAYQQGASDVHVEPNGKEGPVIIRFRVDGECFIYQELPPALRQPLVARLKIMAKLDISERRKPQDGKIRFMLPDRALELRVATIPTVNSNEDVVLRLLASSKPLPLDKLRLSQRNLTGLRALITKPYGLFLCVGPTGSGKTTTLHSAIGSINTPDTKIWTAEDPVEITQPGLRQVQVNPRIEFTFAHAMRAFLRADPDVIMIGEMRDHETASIAVEASLTGHLVVSTLHTNSAPETITRLLDMGLDPFSFGDALLGVLAQRLARGLCPQCRVEERATSEESDQIGRAFDGVDDDELLRKIAKGPLVWRAPGCDACSKTGYKGRIGIHELLTVNDGLRHGIARRAPVVEMRKMAVDDGMRTLLQDGICKVLSGDTDLKQVLGVCSK